MKRYESYKDSGIEGIGEIPTHWETKNLQALAKNEKYSFTGGPFGSDLKFDDYTVSGVRIIQLQNIGDGTFNDDYKIYTSNEKADSLSSCNIFPGEIIIAKMADPVARACIIPNTESRFVMASDGIRLVVNNNVSNSQFATYSINSNYFRSQAELNSSGSTRLRIGLNTLKKLKFVLPPLGEQMIISSFLEKRTAELDKLIADKQKLIELLNEERTAMINQAVTKGLNPNLPMKDTGIEWLGKIPEHWQLSKIKFVCKIIGRIGFRGYTVQDLVKEGEGAISLSPSNIKNHILDISNNCTYLSWMKYEESPEIKIYEKDILVVKTGSTIGKIAIVPKEHPKMTLNPQLIVLKEIKMIPKFLYHIMTSKYFQSYFKIYTAGGSTPAISQEKINNFEIIFPDLVEQEKIVKEVDISITKFHKITEKLNQEIDFLREYKIALISEVVTGKVDVRDEVIGGCHAELVTASALQ